mgnify:CR=1 FL=1
MSLFVRFVADIRRRRSVCGAEGQSRGWMIAEGVGWKPSGTPVQADFYVAGFHTDDYQSRIFSYEKNILYAFNMPSFYGKGVRLAVFSGGI